MHIGSGSYGEVFNPPLVCNIPGIETNKSLVGKVFHEEPSGISEHANILKLMLDEIDPKFLWHVPCPIVARTKDEDMLQLIYEFRGCDIIQTIISKVTLDQCYDIFVNLLTVLHGCAVMSENGIIHNDLKPENILYSPQHGCTIIDYGIAFSVTDEDTVPIYQSIDYDEDKSFYHYYYPQLLCKFVSNCLTKQSNRTHLVAVDLHPIRTEQIFCKMCMQAEDDRATRNEVLSRIAGYLNMRGIALTFRTIFDILVVPQISTDIQEKVNALIDVCLQFLRTLLHDTTGFCSSKYYMHIVAKNYYDALSAFFTLTSEPHLIKLKTLWDKLHLKS